MTYSAVQQRGSSGSALDEAVKAAAMGKGDDDISLAIMIVKQVTNSGVPLDYALETMSKGQTNLAKLIKQASPPESWDDAQWLVQILIDGGAWGNNPIPPGNLPLPSSPKKWLWIGGGVLGGLWLLKKLAK